MSRQHHQADILGFHPRDMAAMLEVKTKTVFSQTLHKNKI